MPAESFTAKVPTRKEEATGGAKRRGVDEKEEPRLREPSKKKRHATYKRKDREKIEGRRNFDSHGRESFTAKRQSKEKIEQG